MISKDSVVCQDSASFIKHVIAVCKVNKILEFLGFLLMKLIKIIATVKLRVLTRLV